MTVETFIKYIKNLHEKDRVREANDLIKTVEIKANEGSVNAQARLEAYQKEFTKKEEKVKKSK